MEHDRTRSTGINSEPLRWLVNSWASRAAVFAAIYLCVNITYQQGYLAFLGIQFGLFSITKTLPVFDNFIMVAYALLIWGFVMEVSPSAYDQFFGFFRVRSWREGKVILQRNLAIDLIVIYFFILKFWFLHQGSWPPRVIIAELGRNMNFHFFVEMLAPTWELVTWDWSMISILLLVPVFIALVVRYRRVRSMGLLQALPSQLKFMEFHINAVTPAAFALGGLFLLVMFPGWAGRLTAKLTIQDMQSANIQEIKEIALQDGGDFCGEGVRPDRDTVVWKSTASDNFTMHLLGALGNFDIFVRVNKDNRDVYAPHACLVNASAIHSILLAPTTGYGSIQVNLEEYP